jgi:two-component system alkaline phosphatase synthesis response regulator PhoP
LISIVIVAKASEKIEELDRRLSHSGFACSFFTDGEKALNQALEKPPDLILLDINSSSETYPIRDFSSLTGMTKKPLLMVLIPRTMLNDAGAYPGIDDFVIKPFDLDELTVRIQRLIRRVKDIDSRRIIRRGDLVIDLASCEVVLGNKLIELTFREYELLRFLAGNRGRVFTREALLNKVWKYDYLGGERTVDVHIRRLRSKIEDADHTFIDTVRNIGYRFRKDV